VPDILISSQFEHNQILAHKIEHLEKAIMQIVKLNKGFKQWLTRPGIPGILAMTIILEVCDVKRFPKVGNFAFYCRCEPSKRLSDGKSTGCQTP